jgi:hypothetical protein
MTIALGMAFTILLMTAVWLAANEPAEALSPVRQVDPDQAGDPPAWDLLGWQSFG